MYLLLSSEWVTFNRIYSAALLEGNTKMGLYVLLVGSAKCFEAPRVSLKMSEPKAVPPSLRQHEAYHRAQPEICARGDSKQNYSAGKKAANKKHEK